MLILSLQHGTCFSSWLRRSASARRRANEASHRTAKSFDGLWSFLTLGKTSLLMKRNPGAKKATRIVVRET